jgi:2-polyprenyl-6-methoxyphenol hydroxylase-like FAD-dependent oxidoreductase
MGLKVETDVLVVGAGPVGLFTALSLAERGARVEIIDKEPRGAGHSYALALHPQSLRLLDAHAAARDLLEHGQRIDRLVFYVDGAPAARLDLAAVGGAFPYLLVVPQSAVERALEARLERAKIEVLWNHQAQGVRESAGEVVTRVAAMEKVSMGYPIARTEWLVAREADVRSAFLVGADGYHSFVRRATGVQFEDHGAAEGYAVYEFACPVDFAHEVRVVFHGATTSVLWPLGERRARWSFQVDPHAPPARDATGLHDLLRERAPWFENPIEELHWTDAALFERKLADRFGGGRTWLVGDAAHITGPVGAQSMNVGLREADDLAGCLSAALQDPGCLPRIRDYGLERTAEWRSLLGIGEKLVPLGESPPWFEGRQARILSCIPASGQDLRRLLAQIGLRLA